MRGTAKKKVIVAPHAYPTKTHNKYEATADEVVEVEEGPVKNCLKDFVKDSPRKKATKQAKTEPAKRGKNVVIARNEEEIDEIIREAMKMNQSIPKTGAVRFQELTTARGKGRTIAGLAVKNDVLAPCTEKHTEWKKLSMAVDSGACESVIDAETQLPGYEVMETKASRGGLTYVSAAGEDIPNLGELMVPMVTTENTKRCMKMQVAEVTRPLASVKRMCEAGHAVVFDDEGSFIINKSTGEVNYLREEGGQ